MLLPACYAVSGTDLAYGTTYLRPQVILASLPSDATWMFGTDPAYAATRNPATEQQPRYLPTDSLCGVPY
eukprot:3387345-Rhodomonas_salina.2